MITFARHMRPRPLAFALAALSWLAPVEAANDLGLSAAYAEAVRQYARGERAEALAALARLRPDQLDAQVQALENAARRAVRCPSCPDPVKELPLRAAVMLHADLDEAELAAAVSGPQPKSACPGDHAVRAARIAALLAEGAPTNGFARRFFLALAQRSQKYFCFEGAQKWGRDGLKLFPRDPALLDAVAAALEEEALLWAPQEPALVASHRKEMEARAEAEKERNARFAEAERLLVQAVAADPSRADARVRLGRVQGRLGRTDAARQTLEESLRRGGPAPFLYLAHLCLGQLDARASRLDDAEQEFSRALALDPQSQAAAVALSEVLLRSGDDARARRVLEQALAHAGRRRTTDSHWRAAAIHTAHLEDLLDELRRESEQ
jgi:tetratricopeptide (TPR) repeat protein